MLDSPVFYVVVALFLAVAIIFMAGVYYAAKASLGHTEVKTRRDDRT